MLFVGIIIVYGFIGLKKGGDVYKRQKWDSKCITAV